MKQKEMERRQTAAADRITGTWFCTGGRHRAKGEPIIYRGRKICATCVERIKARKRAA